MFLNRQSKAANRAFESGRAQRERLVAGPQTMALWSLMMHKVARSISETGNRASSGAEGAAYAQRSRASPTEMGLLCFHDLATYLALLDETASTRRVRGTPFGRSHSPASAFFHCHHSFSCAHHWKEPINYDVAKRFLKAFRQWLLDHPEFGGRRTLDKQVTR